MEQNLGKNSIVGTTIKNPELLPEHLNSDEKHSQLKGQKIYVATTVGNHCILGVSISQDAGEQSLTQTDGKFREKALNLNPEYHPKSVSTDGWKPYKSLEDIISICFCDRLLFACFTDPARNTEHFLTLLLTDSGTVMALNPNYPFLSEFEGFMKGFSLNRFRT